MKVAVIGGNGFLGRYVAMDLQNNNYNVCVMDIQDISKGDFEYRKCDITNLEMIEHCLCDIDAIALTAAIPAPRPFEIWPEIMRVNVLGTFNVFYAAVKKSIPKIVFASSICAQGWLGGEQKIQPRYYPIDEEHPDLPQEPYSASKKMNEINAQGFSITHDTAFIGLRFCEIANVEDSGVGTLHTPSIQWTKVDVRDAASAYRCALQSEGIKFDYFIIGSRHRYNKDSTIQKPGEIEEALKKEGATDIRDRRFISESKASHSSDKAMQVLGYDPKF